MQSYLYCLHFCLLYDVMKIWINNQLEKKTKKKLKKKNTRVI